MAKDPRFNFYPDNWSGGTKRMTFEQKGAYMELLLLNFYCLSDGLPGFTEQEAAKALASAAAYAGANTELWNFLMPKFKTDGKFYWSERMVKEFHKSKKASSEQSKRASKRWHKERDMPRHIPVMEMEMELEIEDKNKKESLSKIEVFESLFNDQRYITDLSMAHKGKDLKQAFEECWIYHSQTPSPPEHLWQWKQKLNTWLTIKRDNATSKNKQSTSDLAQAFANRVVQQNSSS